MAFRATWRSRHTRSTSRLSSPRDSFAVENVVSDGREDVVATAQHSATLEGTQLRPLITSAAQREGERTPIYSTILRISAALQGQAPRMNTAMLAALDKSVVDTMSILFCRIYAWWMFRGGAHRGAAIIEG